MWWRQEAFSEVFFKAALCRSLNERHLSKLWICCVHVLNFTLSTKTLITGRMQLSDHNQYCLQYIVHLIMCTQLLCSCPLFCHETSLHYAHYKLEIPWCSFFFKVYKLVQSNSGKTPTIWLNAYVLIYWWIIFLQELESCVLTLHWHLEKAVGRCVTFSAILVKQDVCL